MAKVVLEGLPVPDRVRIFRCFAFLIGRLHHFDLFFLLREKVLCLLRLGFELSDLNLQLFYFLE